MNNEKDDALLFAFPFGQVSELTGQPINGLFSVGLTKREYAAIHLRVPDSGSDWLDKMIEQRLRDEVAAKVMHGYLFHIEKVLKQDEMRGLANMSYCLADVMLKARGTA